jgi:ribose transport system substrate-binding protein
MMHSTIFKYLVVTMIATGIASTALAQENPSLFLTRASAKLATELGFKNRWDGPTTGARISGKRRIVFIGSDFTNTSIASILRGVREASAVANWEIVPIDCWSRPSRHAEAFSQAWALKPDGIILAGINAHDLAKEMKITAAKKIPLVGWHAAIKIGAADGLFANIGTNPKDAGQTAALLSVVDGNGKAGVVVFTDPTNLYSIAKSNEIVDVIKRCQTCSLLALEELPINQAAEKMSATLNSLTKQFGKKWTHTISIHDMYLDMIATPASAAIIAINKPKAISAGDGSASSYKRIRNKEGQIGIVPEPLTMQGWQIIDELNRALTGMPPSNYMPPVYAVTNQNIAFHGGPNNMFDPENGYRNEYRKIWGK